ncbi:hypothetical protein DRH13_00140 [Candidatus Woesebacteria bacterium]|nr:MAG: hypothetical protein DRH13_00140 [Candidatus Woesebacteria bacterium]
MSATGTGTSIVCGKNHSSYLPVQLLAGQTMVWEHGVGRFAYFVEMYLVTAFDAATGNIEGNGSGMASVIARQSLGALPFVLSQPSPNVLVIDGSALTEDLLFILEVKFEPSSKELDLIIQNGTGGVNDFSDPRIAFI